MTGDTPIIGVNFYKAARLEPPPNFKVQFQPLSPYFLANANFAMPVIKLSYSITNNNMTVIDIYGNQTISFI